jgi:hypothetical protein
MRIFGGRRRAGGSRPRPRHYRVSLELGWCEFFAFQLAHCRSSSTLEPRDILGGIFVATLEFPRIAQYWRAWQDFEDLVVSECGSLGARMTYWLLAWEGARRQRRGFYAPFGSKRRSPDLDAVYATAEASAAARDGALNQIPMLTPEDILLGMVKRAELPISGRLLLSGLVTARLEEAVRTLRPRPPA